MQLAQRCISFGRRNESDIPSNPAVVIASLKMGYDGRERGCDDSLAVSTVSPTSLQGSLTNLIQRSKEHRTHQSEADNS